MKKPEVRALTAIRLRADERQLFEKAAEIVGKSLSEFMRDATAAEARRIIRSKKGNENG